ncbi:MAG: hypothetical protein LIO58_08595 [Oscillospiraceae bacterium]|nr:hypothetical protein [Oscillospiraceae bacterium]
MSEVNADGVLLNPRKALLQEVQHLSNDIAAPEAEGADSVDVQLAMPHTHAKRRKRKGKR